MGCAASASAGTANNFVVRPTSTVSTQEPAAQNSHVSDSPQNEDFSINRSPAIHLAHSPYGTGYLSIPSVSTQSLCCAHDTPSSDETIAPTIPPLQMFRRATIAGDNDGQQKPPIAVRIVSGENISVTPPTAGRQLPSFILPVNQPSRSQSTPVSPALPRESQASPVPLQFQSTSAYPSDASTTLLETHLVTGEEHLRSQPTQKGMVSGLRRSVALSSPQHGDSFLFAASHSYGVNSVSLSGLPFAFSSSELADERSGPASMSITAPNALQHESVATAKGYGMLISDKQCSAAGSPVPISLSKVDGIASANTGGISNAANSRHTLTTKGSTMSLIHSGNGELKTIYGSIVREHSEGEPPSQSQRPSFGPIVPEALIAVDGKGTADGGHMDKGSQSQLPSLLSSHAIISSSPTNLHQPWMGSNSTTVNTLNMHQSVPSPTSRATASFPKMHAIIDGAHGNSASNSRSISPQQQHLFQQAAQHPLSQRLRIAPGMQHQRRSLSMTQQLAINSTSDPSSPETSSPQLSTVPSGIATLNSSSSVFVSALTSRRRVGPNASVVTVVPGPAVPFVEEIAEEDINEASISARMQKDADSNRAAELHAKYPDNSLLVKRVIEETARRGSHAVSRRDSQLPQSCTAGTSFLHPLRGSTAGFSSNATSAPSTTICVATGQLIHEVHTSQGSPGPSPITPGLPLTLTGNLHSPSKSKARASLLAFAEGGDDKSSDVSGRVTATSSSRSTSRTVPVVPSLHSASPISNTSVEASPRDHNTAGRRSATNPSELLPIVSYGGHSFDTRWGKGPTSIGSAFPTMQEIGIDNVIALSKIKTIETSRPLALVRVDHQSMAEASPLIAKGPQALAAFGLQLPDPNSSPRETGRKDRRHYTISSTSKRSFENNIQKERDVLPDLSNGFEPINATTCHAWEAYGVATVESGSDSDEE